MCGRGLATYLCRCSLPNISILEQLDSAFANAASTLHGVPLSDNVLEQLTDRYTAGGYGYRPIAPYARLAYLAAEQETRDLQSRILKPQFMERTMSRLLADTTVTAFDATVTAAVMSMVDSPPSRQLQRTWSRLLDRQRQLPEDTQRRARLLSCAGSHLSIHPIILPGEKFEWMDNDQFTVISRMRLGQPVFSVQQICPFCRVATSDTMGNHVLSCLHGGHHTRAHNLGRDDLAKLAGQALVSPSVESHCFPAAPSRRIDILMRALTFDRRPTAVDYALISHTAHSLEAAAQSIGGAATAYEAVKEASYGALAEQAGLYLAPMVQDVYGAWGVTARAIILQLARRIADRDGQHRGTTSTMIHRWLLSRLQRRVADILLRATPPNPTALD